MKRKLLVLLLGLSMIMMFAFAAGCSRQEAEPEETETEEVGEEAEDDEENYDTGDASLDNPRNQDEIGENELLVVSFGTSFNDSRRLTIGAIEQAVEDAVGDTFAVRRAFTAQIIIDHILKRDKVQIDNVEAALKRAQDNGVKTLVVQPTHLMAGIEYDELKETLAGYADSFEKVAVGEPLCASDDDKSRVADALIEVTKDYDDGETAIVLMGHGTEHASNALYAEMQQVFDDKGAANIFVGTVEAEPSLEDVLAKVKEGNYKRVVLRPMMVVAGDHANNDMAAEDDPESWYSQFRAAGYEVETVLEGLGQIPAIQDIYVEHAKAAIDSLG